MAIPTPEERIAKFERTALEFNAEMPTDIWMKGDGTFWITRHGNDGVRPRKATNEEVLRFVFLAIEYGNRATSI